jgi:hypothetical protein
MIEKLLSIILNVDQKFFSKLSEEQNISDLKIFLKLN